MGELIKIKWYYKIMKIINKLEMIKILIYLKITKIKGYYKLMK